MKVVKVVVSSKTTKNDQYGKGTNVCYYIGDKEAPLVKLNRMNENNKFATYLFDIDCEGYPFVLETKNGDNIVPLTRPIEKGKLKFKVDTAFPNAFHYTCSIHSGMGGPVKIESNEDVKLKKLEIGKPLKNAVSLKPYKDTVLLGLSGGQIYKYANDNISIFRDINSVIKKHGFFLYDFIVLSDDRVFALISGIRKEKNAIDLVEVTQDNSVSSHITFTGDLTDAPISVHAYKGVIYIIGKKNIYRIVPIPPDNSDPESAGGFDCPEDNQKNADEELTEIYIKAPIEATAAFVRKGFVFLADKELWKENEKIYTFPNSIQSASMGISEKEFLTATKDGIISQFSYENGKITLDRQCRIHEGIVSIVKTNEIYILVNDAEGRSSLYTIVQW